MDSNESGRSASSSSLSRRQSLKRIAVLGTATSTPLLAGCTGNGGSGNGGNGGNGGSDGSESGSQDGSSGGSNEELDITLASTYEEGHINVQAAKMFRDRIEEETDGAITVEVASGGSYGSEAEITDLASQNVVGMHSGAGVPFSMYAPEYYIIDMPFVMEDADHLFEVVESEKFAPAYDLLIEEGNQRQLGTRFYRGQRYFTANESVAHPDDVQGMQFRSPPLEPWVQIWSEIGVEPTSVALDELFSALQQGVVDAAEGDIEQIHSFNYPEVQDYLSATRHAPFSGAMYMNESVYQGLSESYQTLVDDVAAEVAEEANEMGMQREQELIDDLVDQGMTLVEDVDREAFREGARPAVNALFEDRWVGTWEEWRNV
ncbi:TRAP transporter substrate-binding protein [Halopenitus sp. POP-27]|uniref:TRAP transporter substrate-binding protein n=1 Tax=Halopenitus sp. POP-27 TaxID=2994425 RepID=UPI002468B768|nr:TRAP transporter substrate-binding protein [Halopenitus sp. POP-27]